MDEKLDKTEDGMDDALRLERMRAADSALRMALNRGRDGSGVKYPHNFAFQAMQKVHEKELARKRKSRIAEIAMISLSSVAGLVTLALLIDWDKLVRLLFPKNIFSASAFTPEMPGLRMEMVCVVAFCFVFFVCLNNLLKKIFKEEG